jgi:hypothetical protein
MLLDNRRLLPLLALLQLLLIPALWPQLQLWGWPFHCSPWACGP